MGIFFLEYKITYLCINVIFLKYGFKKDVNDYFILIRIYRFFY